MFITFEGIEGSGKSTQAELLAKALRSKGKQVLSTREPGGTAVGDSLRALLLTLPMTTQCELFIVLAARAEHLHKMILPALEQNHIVICDRYSDSTLAYQGYGRDYSIDEIKNLHSAAGFRDPDLTFLINISEDESRKRVESRGEKSDRMENEKREFHEKVRRGFLQIAKNDPQRIVILDGNTDVQSLHQSILNLVHQRMDIK